jgi:glycerol-3-phosphate acyltransferase PlsY
MPTAWLLASASIGYLLGSLPFGYLVARAHGVDIFKVGSGNPGATNVKRVLGAKAGHSVLVLDVLKGALATSWPLLPALRIPDAELLGLVGIIAAVLGHSYSLFTGFRGGKGVATAAGGLVVLIPVACAIAGATWVVMFYASRYVSLASILAAAAVVVASWLLPYHLAIRVVATLLGLFIIVRHRENITRLLNGTENKFVKKPPAPG